MEMDYLKTHDEPLSEEEWSMDFIRSIHGQTHIEPLVLEKPQAMKNEEKVSDFMAKNNIKNMYSKTVP